MTETDISKVLIEGDYATIMGVKYKRVEEPKSPVEEAYRNAYGHYPETSSFAVSDWDVVSWEAFQKGYEAAQPKAVPECPNEPYKNVRAYWDEKDNPNIQKIIDKMIEERNSKKLWNRVRNELGYSIELTDEIVDLVEKWLPDGQSASGSQNTFVECSVEGYNDCLNSIKEMLR